jgi:hypothetical protein
MDHGRGPGGLAGRTVGVGDYHGFSTVGGHRMEYEIYIMPIFSREERMDKGWMGMGRMFI